MSDEILNAMRALREDMRQRLMQAPEYRALVALDRAIDEVCAILHDLSPVAAPQNVAAPQAEAETETPEPAPQIQPQPIQSVAAEPAATPAAKHNAIAAAFAETLAARLDQRNGARAAAYQASRRVHFE